LLTASQCKVIEINFSTQNCHLILCHEFHKTLQSLINFSRFQIFLIFLQSKRCKSSHNDFLSFTRLAHKKTSPKIFHIISLHFIRSFTFSFFKNHQMVIHLFAILCNHKRFFHFIFYFTIKVTMF
jgi:hypothetical protein